mgnify:CR=1 FL=1
MAGPGSVPPKRKEIYKYEAPWTVFSMNWSVRPDKRFRLALGSFVEEYNNKVQVITNLIIKKIYIFVTKLCTPAYSLDHCAPGVVGSISRPVHRI